MGTILRIVPVALLALGVARAQEPCRGDADRLCAGSSRGRIFACLQANEAKLSGGCRQQVAAVSKKVKEVGAACGDDVWLRCPGARAGGGRVLRCLEAKGAKLTKPCQRTIAQVREKSAEFEKACGDDVTKRCPGVPKGLGRVLACLKSKHAELSPACQAVVQPPWAAPTAPGSPASAAPAKMPVEPPPLPVKE